MERERVPDSAARPHHHLSNKYPVWLPRTIRQLHTHWNLGLVHLQVLKRRRGNRWDDGHHRLRDDHAPVASATAPPENSSHCHCSHGCAADDDGDGRRSIQIAKARGGRSSWIHLDASVAVLAKRARLAVTCLGKQRICLGTAALEAGRGAGPRHER